MTQHYLNLNHFTWCSLRRCATGIILKPGGLRVAVMPRLMSTVQTRVSSAKRGGRSCSPRRRLATSSWVLHV